MKHFLLPILLHRLTRASYLVVGVLMLWCFAAGELMGQGNLDKPFSKPMYLIHITETGTISGPRKRDDYILYPEAPKDGILITPDGEGGTFTNKAESVGGPFRTLREVCQGAAGAPSQALKNLGCPSVSPATPPANPTPTPVPPKPQEDKRNCQKSFTVWVNGQRQPTNLTVTKRFYDWTAKELEGYAEGGRYYRGQREEEQRKYARGDYRQIKEPTKKQDCAGYVMDQLWQTGPYWVTAPKLYDDVIARFGQKISNPVGWGSVQPNDIIVYGNKGHVAIVKEVGPSGIIVETKDGAESVYRHNLTEAGRFGSNDPLITAFGTPNVYRVDPSRVSLVPLTNGECDEQPTPTSSSGGPSGTGGNTGTGGPGPSSLIGGPWITPTGDSLDLSQSGNRITGSYRGILGTGEITGTFDGKNLAATYRSKQSLIPFAVPFALTLLEDGKLVGRLETPLGSTPLSLTRNNR